MATLSGGRASVYDLKVFVNGEGFALGDFEFSYKIEINDVSPSFGSVLGGTLLTI